jgi:hypothetical protein
MYKVAATDRAWGKVIQRYTDARPQVKVLVRSFVALADRGLSRVATLTGIKGRQVTVTDRSRTSRQYASPVRPPVGQDLGHPLADQVGEPATGSAP